MLVSGGEIAIPPESYVLPQTYRDHTRFDHLPWESYSLAVLGRMLRHPGMAEWELDLDALISRADAIPPDERSLGALVETVYAEWAHHHAPGVSRWGDKTPLNTLWLPRIDRMFPRALYVHILRDGRDVASSYVKAGLYEDPVEAARRWQMSVRAARRHGRRVGPERFLEVRYEDLVQDPVPVLESISDFLDLTYSDRMLEFWKGADRLGDTHLGHHANVRNPLRTDSVGRWREALGEREKTSVMAVLSADLKASGYGGEA